MPPLAQDTGSIRVLLFSAKPSTIHAYLPANYESFPAEYLPLGWEEMMKGAIPEEQWDRYEYLMKTWKPETVVIGTDQHGWNLTFVTGRLASGNFWPLAAADNLPSLALDVIDAVYMAGFSDEQDGNVESPYGFFHRVGRFLVLVDERGGKELIVYSNISSAMEGFQDRSLEYDRWVEVS